MNSHYLLFVVDNIKSYIDLSHKFEHH